MDIRTCLAGSKCAFKQPPAAVQVVQARTWRWSVEALSSNDSDEIKKLSVSCHSMLSQRTAQDPWPWVFVTKCVEGNLKFFPR